jgi:hypothetical protein
MFPTFWHCWQSLVAFWQEAHPASHCWQEFDELIPTYPWGQLGRQVGPEGSLNRMEVVELPQESQLVDSGPKQVRQTALQARHVLLEVLLWGYVPLAQPGLHVPF